MKSIQIDEIEKNAILIRTLIEKNNSNYLDLEEEEEPDWNEVTCGIICNKIFSENDDQIIFYLQTLLNIVQESPKQSTNFFINNNLISLLFSRIYQNPLFFYNMFQITEQILLNVPYQFIENIIPEALISTIFEIIARITEDLDVHDPLNQFIFPAFRVISILSSNYPPFFEYLRNLNFLPILYQIADSCFQNIINFFSLENCSEHIDSNSLLFSCVKKQASILSSVYFSFASILSNNSINELPDFSFLLQELFVLISIDQKFNFSLIQLPLYCPSILNILYYAFLQNDDIGQLLIDNNIIPALTSYILLLNLEISSPAFFIISKLLKILPCIGLFDVSELFRAIFLHLQSFFSTSIFPRSHDILLNCLFILSIIARSPEYSEIILSPPLLEIIITFLSSGSSDQMHSVLPLLQQIISLAPKEMLQYLIFNTDIIEKLGEMIDPDGEAENINVLSCLNMLAEVSIGSTELSQKFVNSIDFDDLSCLLESNDLSVSSFAKFLCQFFV